MSAVTHAVAAAEVSGPASASARRGTGVGGRIAEFLLVGGATLFLFPLSWWARATFGLDDAELATGFTFFWAAHFVNDPHFSVTYLLFYRDAKRRATSADIPRAQRARWVIAGVIVPIALVIWAGAAIALRSAQTLGWMVQLMFLLVGWHYAKQGFGVLTVLSARRGVTFSAGERRAILAHCYAAWAFAWANPATPAGEFEEKGVVYRAVARPAALELVAGGALAVTTALMIATLARRWWRGGRAIPATPLVGFLATIWGWTIFSSIDPLVRYAVPALHSLQYLYFVWLMSRNQARAAEAELLGPPVGTRLAMLGLGALALGFVLFRGAPALLDALALVPGDAQGELGPTPFFAAFFVVINVHHYFMDHVIWRRENAETRFLREPDPTPATDR